MWRFLTYKKKGKKTENQETQSTERLEVNPNFGDGMNVVVS